MGWFYFDPINKNNETGIEIVNMTDILLLPP